MEAIEKKLAEMGCTVESGAAGNSGVALSVTVPREKLHEAAETLRREGFDFLFDIVGMDYGDAGLGTIYYLNRSFTPEGMLALKTSTPDREKPELLSVFAV